MAARFDAFARLSSHTAGRPASFVVAVSVVLLWIVTGPLFHWSDTWQLVINTGTTIVTFLMVFLIQATQNRDTAAIQVKLDELIRSSTAAHNAMLDLEELDEQELERIRRTYQKLASKARAALRGKLDDEAAPEDALQRDPKG